MSERMYDLEYVLACLDRCEHGRHQADHCLSCPGGVNHGNPLMNEMIGFDIGGAAVYVHDIVRAAAAREQGPGPA